MPNLNETRKSIEKLVRTNVETILPIAFDNVPFSDEGVDEYAHLSIHFTGSTNINIGVIISKRIRHTGSIVFKLYMDIDKGTSGAFVLLDSIKTQVENKYITDNLITYAAEASREGVGNEGYYTYFLRIPFVSDEC